MVNEIVWSIKANATFEAIISYLATEWSEREAIDFVNRVDEKLEVLRAHPKIGMLVKNKNNTYRTILHKRITLVYHYKPIKKELTLITFWNNWQNPKRLKY
jgi:plasmid stabilization system protein ParE